VTFRVLLTRRLPEEGLEPLSAAGHEVVGGDSDEAMALDQLAAEAAEVDGIVSVLTDPVNADVLQAGANGRLRVVSNVATGFDNIDVATARALGIAVCHTPGVLDHSTADLTFLLILAARRDTTTAEADLREGRWKGWTIGDHLGHDVHGSILGLVGYGRIAREVARRAEGFGMEVLHHTRSGTGFPGFVGELDELLRISDVVSLHVPLNEDTHHLIDSTQLAKMKPSAVLVNTSRGPVVDEEALAVALERGTIFGAGLDVYDREPQVHPRLLAAPRTVLLPHVGSATFGTRTQMTRMACAGVCDVLGGRTPPNLVPWPAA
jgi:glyoxylate reductase